MKNNNIITTIREFAIKNTLNDDIHGFPHVKRVLNLCLYIGINLNANLNVLQIATLLHDIGRLKENGPISKPNHSEISANLASDFLNSSYFKFSKNDLENIIHCIKAHSFSSKITPHTLEAKILSDADKLDAIGAIGLYRTIAYTLKNRGNLNDVIKHLEEKILKIKDILFLDISNEIAEKRYKIIEDFYEEIKEEI